MPVLVTRKAPASVALRSQRVRAIAEKMLQYLERDSDELSILLTDDTFITSLNATHRGKDGPTDVLSFAQEEGESSPGEQEPALLGDVVISLDTAERQARARRHSLLEEVTFLLAHGILHLIGYDHQTDEEEAAMNVMTAQLVESAKT